MSSFPSLVATESASSRRNSTPQTEVLIGQTSALDEATGSNGLTAKRLPRSVSPYTSRVGSHQSDAAMETLEPLDFSNSIHTTVSASLLGECEGQTESRSIVVTSDRVWCAEKESIVIRSLDDASTVHIIHKTPYMGFIWVLENVYHTVWVGCSDGHIRVLNQTSYKELQDLHAHSSGIYAMLHSGPYVFSGSADFYVLQWSAETCELIRKIDLSSGGIRCLCTVNAQIACGSDDGKIRLLETHSGACLQQWDAHSAGIRCVLRIGETSRFWSAGEDGLIKVWDATTGEELQALTGHGGLVTSMLYFCGSVWSGGVDGTIIVWDSISGSLIHRMVHHKGYITCLARIQRSDMGIIWTAGSDKALKRWSCLCTPKSEFEDEALPNEDLQHHLSLECERNQVLNTENAALRSEIVALKSKLQTTQCTTTVPHSAPSSEPGKGKARRVTNHVQGRTGLVDELQLKLHEKEHRIRQLEKEKLTEKDRTNELQLTLTRLQEYVDLMHEQNKSKQLEAGSRNAQTGQNALQDLLKEREQKLEKAKKELDVSRLGQDYNMKMILELQHRVDILERSSAQLQKEISTRDEIICDLRKSVFPTNPSHTRRQRDPPDPVINTLNLSTDEPKRMSFNTVETIAQQLQKQIDELVEASNRLHEDTLESYEKLRSCRSRSSGSLDSTMEHNASSNFVYNMQVIYVLLQRTQSDISQLVDNLKDLRTASPGRLSGPSRGPSHTVSPTHSQRVGVNPSVPPTIRKLSNGGNVYLPGNSETEVRSFSNVENSVPASPQSALSTTNHSSSFNVQSAVASSMKEEPQKTTEDPQSGRLVHLISNQPSTLSGSMSNRAAVSARLRASRAMTPTKTMTRPTNTVNPNLLLRRRMSPVCAKLRPDGSRCTSPTYTGFARKGISGSQSTLKLS